MESPRERPAPGELPPAPERRPDGPAPSSDSPTSSEGPQWRRRRLERFAFFLDDAIRIPGTQRRVGFDALIGLIPGIGDAAGLLLSSFILYEGARLGVGLATLARMAFNIGLEALVGLVPGLGDLFDFVFKANDRNVRLVERYLDDPDRTRRSSRTLLLTVAAALILLLVGLIIGGIWLVSLLLEALGGAA